jgi:hypothetical protein
MTAVPLSERRLRSSEELQAALEAIERVGVSWYAAIAGPVYYRAMIETIRWALGQRSDAPVSGEVLGRPVMARDAKREQYYAWEAMQGIQRTGLPMAYLTGVENTAAWRASCAVTPARL